MRASRRTGISPSSVCLMLLSLVGLYVGRVQAERTIMGGWYIPEDQECWMGLRRIVTGLKWEGTTGTYNILCNNKNAAVTYYAAFYKYCAKNEIEGGYPAIVEACAESAKKKMITPEDLAANLTADAVAQLPVYGKKDVDSKANQTAPFMVNKAWFNSYNRAQHDLAFEKRKHVVYGFAQYGFWGPILIFGMLQNLIRYFVDKRRGYVYSDPEGTGRAASKPTPALFKPITVVYALARKYLTTPSLFPPYHQQRVLGCSLPTRIESLVVYAFWALSIILNAVSFLAYDGNALYKTVHRTTLLYLAQRASVLCTMLIPLIWAFSGRNNIFLWLTGWQFGTFNIFHRHIARICVIEAIIHSVSYSCYYAADAKATYLAMFEQSYFVYGVVVTTLMSFMMAFSSSYFRAKLYDSFLVIHIVFAALIIPFLWQHLAHQDNVAFNYPFLYPAIAIWSFDRGMRVVRQLYINFHVGRRSGKTVQKTKSMVTFDSRANILHFDVVPANSHLFMGPGQHYYLYQPFRFLGWENHPFTLANWTREGGESELHLHFWVRPYDGWTKRIRNECMRKGSGGVSATINTSMLLEGPYGLSEPVHTFEEVLFIVGGTGIATISLYLKDYLERLRVVNSHCRTRTRHITLVWADRSETHIRHTVSWSFPHILGRDDINVELYLTGDGAGAANSSSSGSSISEEPSPTSEKTEGGEGGNATDSGTATPASTSVINLSQRGQVARDLFIQSGRPDVGAIVHKAASRVHGTNNRLAVMVCGPAQLADITRHAVARNMEPTRGSIEYFEETFGW